MAARVQFYAIGSGFVGISDLFVIDCASAIIGGRTVVVCPWADQPRGGCSSLTDIDSFSTSYHHVEFSSGVCHQYPSTILGF